MEGGKYPDLSTVCGKKKSRRKKCFVPDFMINIINKEMYDKNKEKNQKNNIGLVNNKFSIIRSILYE